MKGNRFDLAKLEQAINDINRIDTFLSLFAGAQFPSQDYYEGSKAIDTLRQARWTIEHFKHRLETQLEISGEIQPK